MPGVADMTADAVVRQRSASRHSIVTIDGQPVFVKRGVPVALAREASMLRHLQRVRGHLQPLAPVALAFDRCTGRLCVEGLVGWRTLHELFTDDDDEELEHARRLGARLAELHTLDHVGIPAAPGHVPRLELGPLQMADLCGETLALIGHLQRMPGLQRDLARLRTGPPERTLVHGDAKLDNVLCGEGNRIVLVDFEHGGAGDPAWDVGAPVGDYLSRWLLSVRCIPGESLATWLRRAEIPARRCAAAGRALLAGYGAVRPLPDLDRVAASAGIFLLHRAQAWIERYGRFGAKAVILARCGGGLVGGRRRALERLLEAAR